MLSEGLNQYNLYADTNTANTYSCNFFAIFVVVILTFIIHSLLFSRNPSARRVATRKPRQSISPYARCQKYLLQGRSPSQLVLSSLEIHPNGVFESQMTKICDIQLSFGMHFAFLSRMMSWKQFGSALDLASRWTVNASSFLNTSRSKLVLEELVEGFFVFVAALDLRSFRIWMLSKDPDKVFCLSFLPFYLTINCLAFWGSPSGQPHEFRCLGTEIRQAFASLLLSNSALGEGKTT